MGRFSEHQCPAPHQNSTHRPWLLLRFPAELTTTIMVVKWWLLNFYNFYTFTSGCSTVRKSFPCHLFVSLFVSVSMDSWIHILFSGLNKLLLLFVLMFKLSQIWPLGDSSGWLLVPYWACPHHSLSTALLSGTEKCSRLILYFSCLGSEVSYFSREIWFLLVENGVYKLRSGQWMCS